MALTARVTGVVLSESSRGGKTDDGREWTRSTVNVLTPAGQTEFTYAAEGSFTMGERVDLLVDVNTYNGRTSLQLVDQWNPHGLEEIRAALEHAALAEAGA